MTAALHWDKAVQSLPDKQRDSSEQSMLCMVHSDMERIPKAMQQTL